MSDANPWSAYLQALQQLCDLVAEDDPDGDDLEAAATAVQARFSPVQALTPEPKQASLALARVQVIRQRADILCARWRDAGTLDDRRRRALGAYASVYRGGDARYLDRRQ